MTGSVAATTPSSVVNDCSVASVSVAEPTSFACGALVSD
jgi:hypothetical protein